MLARSASPLPVELVRRPPAAHRCRAPTPSKTAGRSVWPAPPVGPAALPIVPGAAPGRGVCKVLRGHDLASRGVQSGHPVASPPFDHEAFLTTDEVLAYLQVNLRTVYRLIDAGKLPAVRVGRQWRFRRRDIDAWLDQQRVSAPPAGGPPAAPGRGPGRILVVDADAPTRDLVSTALRGAGHTVDTAPDGVVGATRLGAADYDLVVTELRLPALDAFAMVREGRRRTPGLRVMVVTGHSSEAAAIEALNFGVQGYLVKPARPAEVVATAARVLA